MAPTANLVTLRGTVRHIIDLSLALTETVTLSVPSGLSIVDSDDRELRITQEPYRFTLQQLEQGVTVVATDDVNCNPPRWFYELTESWSNRRSVPVVLPSDAPGGVVRYESLGNAGTLDNPVVIPTVVKRVNGVAPDADGDVVITVTGGGGGDGGPPSGAAGGVLAGTYPNPTFASPMTTTAALNTALTAYGKPRGSFAAGTALAVNDFVVASGIVYRCTTAHTTASIIDLTKFEDWGPQTAFSDARYLPRPWAASTFYVANQPAFRPADGALMTSIGDQTSGATFDGATWRYVAGGSSSTTGVIPETPSVKTAAYALVLTDAGKMIEVDSTSNVAITVPPHSLVPFPVGTTVRVRQVNTGQAVITSGAATTLRTPWSTRTRGKYSTIRLHKRDYHEWVLEEDLAQSVSPPATSLPVSVTMNVGDHSIDPLKQFGYAVSAFTGQAGDIRYNTALQASANSLGPGYYRFALRWNAGAAKPYAGANGAINDTLGAEAWIVGINASRVAGAAIVGIIEGATEMSATPTEAGLIVQYALDHSWGITDWIIGNEPELSGSTSKIDWQGRDTHDGRNYGKMFCEIGAAVKAVDPTCRLWGPAASQFGGHIRTDPATATSPGAVTQFFNDWLTTAWNGTTVAALVDVMCWHKYLDGVVNTDQTVHSTATLMAKTTDHFTDIGSAKTFVANYVANGTLTSAKQTAMRYSLNEWNVFFQPATGRTGLKDEQGTWYDERPTTAEGTVFMASALRNSCRVTNSYFMWFCDLGGPLGMWTRNPYDLSATPALLGDNMGAGGLLHYPHGKPALTPYTPYWGMAMFTGGPLGIRRFGANIPVMPSHGITNLEVMASTNNGGDIILINKDETNTRNLTITTTGITSGQVAIWQTVRHAPWDKPIQIGTTVIVGSTFNVVSPPMTVTRCVINP